MKAFPFVFHLSLFFFLLITNIVFASYAEMGQQIIEDSLMIKQADYFIQKAEKQEKTAPGTALANAQKAINLLQNSSPDNKLVSQAFYRKAYAYFMLGEIDSSVIWFHKVLLQHNLDAKTKAKVFNSLSMNYRKLGKYDAASSFAEKAIVVCRNMNDSAGMMESLIRKAQILHVTGNNKKAMQLYFEVLKFEEKQKDTLQEGILYGRIANVYMDIDQNDQGKEYYRKAIQKLQFNNETYLFADVLNNYGIVFYDEAVYDSALFYFNKALGVYNKIGQTDAIAAALQNIGITYVFLDKPAKGLGYLHRSLAMFSVLKLQKDLASVLVDLGRAFVKTNRFDSANYYLTKALHVSTAIHSTYYKKEALLLLFKMNEKAGNYKSAFSHYENYVRFKDSLDNQAMIKNLQELDIKYETAKHEKEIQHLKDQELLDHADKQLMSLGIIGLVLFFVLILILILVRRKKDMQIHKQKALVHQKEKALAKAELAQHEAHERVLENNLEFKTKQLASHALNMMQKNKLLQDISDDIVNRVNSSDCKGKDAMLQVRYSLEKGLNVDKDWDLFKLYFEQVNDHFFDKLKKRNLKLTSNDYRLAALVKLNLSIKEIAGVLNISPDSLKNGRYRLKKKLGLRENEKLNNFIRDI